jgi:hypothetical protein
MLTLKVYTPFVFRDHLAFGVSPGQVISASGNALLLLRDLSSIENCVSCVFYIIRTVRVFTINISTNK